MTMSEFQYICLKGTAELNCDMKTIKLVNVPNQIDTIDKEKEPEQGRAAARCLLVSQVQ